MILTLSPKPLHIIGCWPKSGQMVVMTNSTIWNIHTVTLTLRTCQGEQPERRRYHGINGLTIRRPPYRSSPAHRQSNNGGYPLGIPVFDIRLHYPLLKSTGTVPLREVGLCINSSYPRPGLWATVPDLRLSEHKMGFLSQLAQLCFHAHIKPCGRDECEKKKAVMANSAPQCNWTAFREWALVIMSCQATMETSEKESPAHTHITTVVSGLCKILTDCRRLQLLPNSTPPPFRPFRPRLDGDSPETPPIDLAQVSNLIYWMSKIQSQIGVGPAKLGRWNHHFLPSEVTLPWIERAVREMDGLGLCKNRLWNLVSVSDRKQSDLPDIISVLKAGNITFDQKGHGSCNPSKCQSAHLNSASVTQLHKCKDEDRMICPQRKFPVELLERALELGNRTSWLCEGAKLSGSHDPYIAISHVWSDGTGVGLKEAGTVNSCLFKFFADIADQLDCNAVWWDALSIPSESKARSKALNMMHRNYANAEHTVVHDTSLLNFPWKDDGSPCLALVLSTWFTRGWTALELSMSKSVKVLFKNPNENQPPFLLKDLDKDILAQGPGPTSRAHWLATTLVKKLRQPVADVGDLLAILSSRSTSWVRDRTVIAALLAGVPDCDFNLGESQITTKVLHYLGKIPYFCLLHGKPTMRNKGPYSWCAATLDDMPVDTSADLGGNRSGDLLEIDESGAVDGYWYCHALDSSSAKALKAYGHDLAATVKVDVALAHWEHCLVLHPSAERHHALSLLVIPLEANKKDGVLHCRYVGTVEEPKSERPATLLKIRLGAKEEPYAEGMPGQQAIDTMAGETTPATCNSDERGKSSNDHSGVPGWLGFAEPLKGYSSVYHLQPELVIEKNYSELRRAIQARRENAALYLVKHVKAPGREQLRDIFRELKYHLQGSIEKACASMKLLGDVYAKTGKFRVAIEVYKFVETAYLVQDTGENQLRTLLFKYALATTFVKAARVPGTHEESYIVTDADSTKAREFLYQILQECDRRVPETCREADLPAQEIGNPPKDPTTLVHGIPPSSFGTLSSSSTSQSGEQSSVTRAGQARNALRWRRLELNAITDLTILLIEQEDFDGAARTFQKAFRGFGSLPKQDVEGFDLQSPERGRLGFKKRNKRDEDAADVYQRALKRFDVTFQGDHLLIFLTSLHLGVNQLLSSKFASAETSLMRALNGFVSRLSPLSSHNQNSVLSRDDGVNEHIIIGLTRYHLGVLFRYQHKLEEAQTQLQQAQKIARRFERYHGQLLLLSATYELGMLFSQKLKSEQKIDQLVRDSDKYFKDVSQPAEHWLKGVEDHGSLRRLAMRRLLFLSIGNSTVLHLQHGKLQDEVVETLKNNLEGYTAVAGDPAELTDEGKKVIDVAECEARRILCQAYVRRKEFDSAAIEIRVALDGYIYLYGECHLQTLDTSVMYASVLLHLPNPKTDPEKLLEVTVERYGQTVGSFHPEALLACLKLGEVYMSRQKLAEAEKICKRAHHGFETFYGPNHLLTAKASRLLAQVYAEKGTLGKAQEMYGKTYKAFFAMSNGVPNQVRSGTENEPGSPAVPDIRTLQAAMDYANVSALIRTTVTRNTAMDHYERAIDGFSFWEETPQLSTSELVACVTSKLVACMRLGALHGEICNFETGRQWIKHAHSEFELLVNTPPHDEFIAIRGSLDKSRLEADLKLALLDLNEYKREKNHTDAIKEVRKKIQGIHKELVEKLGEFDTLTLEAYTALGELFLEGHGGSKPQHSPETGEQMLVEVLKQYEPDGNAKLALGHPKKVRIMDSLISYYDRIGVQNKAAGDKMREWNRRLLRELVDAHGYDQAILIIDATSGPKHTARCINFDQGRSKTNWRSGACSETPTFGKGLTAIAKLFRHGKTDSTRTGIFKRKDSEPKEPHQQPLLPKASFTRTNSLDEDRNSLLKEANKAKYMSGTSPRASSSTFAGASDHRSNFQRHSMAFEADLSSSGTLPRSSSFTLDDAPDLRNNFQRHSMAFEGDFSSSGTLPRASSVTVGGTPGRSNHPERTALPKDSMRSGTLPGASLPNASMISITDCLANEDAKPVPPVPPVPKRKFGESAADLNTSSYAAGPSASAHDPHYDGSQKKPKLLGKFKEVKGKFKEAVKSEIKEAGKFWGSSRHKGR